MRGILIVIAVLTGAAGAAAQPWSPPTPTNLKVLPPDTEPRALIMMMRGFTQALGVRCQHCHVYQGDDPNDLTKFNFASDDKAAKATARTMLRMVLAINGDHLKDVGAARPAGEAKVTCYTCHRGETRPLTQRPPQ
jgi:photosynthetic reaction center cytochrome c subunit